MYIDLAFRSVQNQLELGAWSDSDSDATLDYESSEEE